MTPKQFRAARALLDLSLNEAAALAGVAAITVMSFEARQPVDANSFAALKRILDSQVVRLGSFSVTVQPSKAFH
jgi:hypothetical protein